MVNFGFGDFNSFLTVERKLLNMFIMYLLKMSPIVIYFIILKDFLYNNFLK